MAWWRTPSAQTPTWSLEDDHTAFVATLKAQIEQGVAPWQQSWTPGVRRLPEHLVNGNAYRGVNALYLSVVQTAKDYRDNRWATATQIQALGGHVRTGEKVTPVLFDKFDDENEKPPPGGEQDHEQTRPPMVRVYAVFNVEQADGLTLERRDDDRDQKSELKTHKLAERVIQESGVRVVHERGDRAVYNMHTDHVTLPERDQFASANGYYQTALHELGHATGHPNRLDPRHAQERRRGFRQRGVRPRRTARRNIGDADRRAGRRRPRREPWRDVRAGLAHGTGTRLAGNRPGRRRGATHVGLPAAPDPRARTGDRAEIRPSRPPNTLPHGVHRSAPRRRRDRWTRARPWLPPPDPERMIVNPRGTRRHDVRRGRARVPG